jgi:hypothetical protein
MSDSKRKLPDPTEEPFLWAEHSVTKGGTWIPNDASVIEAHEARGWELAEPPAGAQDSLPRNSEHPPGQWVELTHPETLGTQLAPDGDGVVEALRSLGWVPTEEYEADQAKEAKKAERASSKGSTAADDKKE